MPRIIITIPDPLLKEIDREAKQDHRSRAELVRDALRGYVAQRREEQERKARAIEAVQLIDEARRKSAGKGISGADIIKKWRYRLAK
jgi:metal-responsive CopG/Arc/MetJ family transcriptional regulator